MGGVFDGCEFEKDSDKGPLGFDSVIQTSKWFRKPLSYWTEFRVGLTSRQYTSVRSLKGRDSETKE